MTFIILDGIDISTRISSIAPDSQELKKLTRNIRGNDVVIPSRSKTPSASLKLHMPYCNVTERDFFLSLMHRDGHLTLEHDLDLQQGTFLLVDVQDLPVLVLDDIMYNVTLTLAQTGNPTAPCPSLPTVISPCPTF